MSDRPPRAAPAQKAPENHRKRPHDPGRSHLIPALQTIVSPNIQARHRWTDTQFGRRAVNDPNLLRDLRRGRELRPATAARIRRFMAAH